MAEYQRAVEERVEEGMRQIQQTAVGLMHEIAAEMWRASGSDTSDTQTRILNFISRDQAIKSLIQHSDERYQALSARTNRLEDALTGLAESTRALKEVMGRGAQSLHEAAASPALHGVEAIRSQLEQVEMHIAAAFEHISERDRALLETITARVKENGELVTQEAARTVEALQAYVKDGVDAMGRLAQRSEDNVDTIKQIAETQAQELRAGVEGSVATLRVGVEGTVESLQTGVEGTVESLRTGLQEQVDALRSEVEARAGTIEDHVLSVREHDQGMADRIILNFNEKAEEIRQRTADALATHETWVLRTLDVSMSGFGQSLEAQGARDDERAAAQEARADERAAAREARNEELLERQADRTRDSVVLLANEVNRTMDARIHGLGQLVRSDSETLRRALVAAAEGHDHALTRALDEQLGQVTAAVGQVTETIEHSSSRLLDEAIRRIGDVRLALDKNAAQLGDVVNGAIDRNMVRMSETLESEIGKVGQVAAQRAAEATDAAVSARLEETLGDARSRIDASTETSQRVEAAMLAGLGRLEESVGEAFEQAKRTSEQNSAAQEEAVRTIERVQERTASMVEQASRTIEETQAATDTETARRLDERIGALARMIRSDNRVMVERLQQVAEQEPAKHTLRAVKELQANLAGEVMDAIERRLSAFTEQIHRDTQAMAENVARATEKLETAADQVNRRSDAEMQTVIERMGDAMHALASLSRSDGPDRIELE